MDSGDTENRQFCWGGLRAQFLRGGDSRAGLEE